VSGPAAGLTAIVAAAVLKLPAVEAFFLAVVLSGVFQLIMGAFKLGVIGDYIPNAVIKGMLAAIGIILILKQFPFLVGYEKNLEGEEAFIQFSGENTFSSVLNSLNHFTPVAILIGVLGLAILILYESPWVKKRKIFHLFSGPLAVVIMGIGISLLFKNAPGTFNLDKTHFVNIPVAGSAKEFFSFFKFPNWNFITNADVWITAFTIAMVASLETLLGVEAVDKLDPLKRATPSNRELMAQGTGNIVSGLLGGLPLTSVIVRSSANLNAGAKTKMSAIFHGILILVCVVFVPNLLNLIPKAALAAILVFTGYKLSKISLFKEYYQKGWEQFMPFIVTLLAIVFTDLLKGVLIGIGVAVFFIIRSNFRSAIFVMKEKNTVLIRMRKDISFFSKPILKLQLESLAQNSSVIIDMTRAEYIDKDVMDTIHEFMQHAHLKNIKVQVNKSTYNDSKTMTSSSLVNIDDAAH
jgi:MFS superfamily sulfate permease-like transporter